MNPKKTTMEHRYLMNSIQHKVVNVVLGTKVFFLKIRKKKNPVQLLFPITFEFSWALFMPDSFFSLITGVRKDILMKHLQILSVNQNVKKSKNQLDDLYAGQLNNKSKNKFLCNENLLELNSIFRLF